MLSPITGPAPTRNPRAATATGHLLHTTKMCTHSQRGRGSWTSPSTQSKENFRRFPPKSAFHAKGAQGPTRCSPGEQEGRLTTSKPKRRSVLSPRLGRFTCDAAYSLVSPSPASLFPHTAQGDVGGAQPPLRSGQEGVRARGKQAEAPAPAQGSRKHMGTDKSSHIGAAPKNTPWPGRSKRYWCGSATETPPSSLLSSPVPCIPAGCCGKDGTQGP